MHDLLWVVCVALYIWDILARMQKGVNLCLWTCHLTCMFSASIDNQFSTKTLWLNFPLAKLLWLSRPLIILSATLWSKIFCLVYCSSNMRYKLRSSWVIPRLTSMLLAVLHPVTTSPGRRSLPETTCLQVTYWTPTVHQPAFLACHFSSKFFLAC